MLCCKINCVISIYTVCLQGGGGGGNKMYPTKMPPTQFPPSMLVVPKLENHLFSQILDNKKTPFKNPMIHINEWLKQNTI